MCEAENLIHAKNGDSKHSYKNIECIERQHKCFISASFLAILGKFVLTLLPLKVSSKC